MLRRWIAIAWNLRRANRLGMLAAGVAVLGVALVARFGTGSREAAAGGPAVAEQADAAAESARSETSAPTVPRGAPPNAVALVDGRTITRQELTDECLRHYGQEVLGSVANKFLIVEHCRKRGITISKERVDAEIAKIAQGFGLPVDQLYRMLQTERNISPEHYADDIIWPTIALRELAADQLKVNDDEVVRGFETRFGPQVRVRLISVGDREKAEKLRAMAAAAPQSFAQLAQKHSNDVDSASAGGLIPPVRKHLGEPKLEEIAFGLGEGEISEVIPVQGQFLILKCEGHIPARPPGKKEMAAAELEIHAAVRDRKLRTAGTELFRKLQEEARIENIMNDPDKSRAMPGVAATVNGHPITLAKLGEECVARYGREMLQGMITRNLIANLLAQKQLTVTPADIDAEIDRAAVAGGMLRSDKSPDRQAWIANFTRRQKSSEEVYRSEIVWPTVALKKIVGDQIEVTDEDMRKAFEANFGPRVRCRVIVLDNHRRAQEVWDMARRNPTLANFERLAEEYSIEPGSRALRGEVPPIQMHGGQPTLEAEAFALKKGDISGVIQLAETYVILYCEGRTRPIVVKQEEVADDLNREILERKQRLAMAREMDRIFGAARIDNLLDPRASHKPETKKGKANPGAARSAATR